MRIIRPYVYLKFASNSQRDKKKKRKPSTASKKKVQREGENPYFHTSVTFAWPCVPPITQRHSIGGPAPVPNPMRFPVDHQVFTPYTHMHICARLCRDSAAHFGTRSHVVFARLLVPCTLACRAGYECATRRTGRADSAAISTLAFCQFDPRLFLNRRLFK